MQAFPNIPGADKLVGWFEGQASFHDAEVLEVHLDRSKTSWVKIMTVFRPAVVTFSLEEIVDLELADFSCQNVISDLVLEEKKDCLRMTIFPCYGIGGFIEAKRVVVDVAPRG